MSLVSSVCMNELSSLSSLRTRLIP